MEEYPTQKEDAWNNVTHGSRKIKRHSEPLLLSNRFQDLRTNIDSRPLEQKLFPQPPRSLNEISGGPTDERIQASTLQYKRGHVLVTGDSLRGVEANLC